MEIMCLSIISILSAFIGYFVVKNITSALYSPLMSVSNAISGIVIIGAIYSLQKSVTLYGEIYSLLAVFLASVNIFGGCILSERMLLMFHKKTPDKKEKDNV